MSDTQIHPEFLAGLRFAADWIELGAKQFQAEAITARQRAISGHGEPSYQHWRACRAEDTAKAKGETARILRGYALQLEKDPKSLEISMAAFASMKCEQPPT